MHVHALSFTFGWQGNSGEMGAGRAAHACACTCIRTGAHMDVSMDGQTDAHAHMHTYTYAHIPAAGPVDQPATGSQSIHYTNARREQFGEMFEFVPVGIHCPSMSRGGRALVWNRTVVGPSWPLQSAGERHWPSLVLQYKPSTSRSSEETFGRCRVLVTFDK